MTSRPTALLRGIDPKAILRWSLWRMQRAALGTARHGLRLVHPRTLWRFVAAHFVGLARFLLWLHRYLVARDKDDLKYGMKNGPAQHHLITRERRAIVLILTLLLAVGLAYATWRWGRVAPTVAVCTVIVTLYLWGKDGAVLAPAPSLATSLPREQMVRETIAAAALGGVKHVDLVELRKPIMSDLAGGGAWSTEGELVGTLSAQRVVDARAQLASGFHVGRAQVVVTPVRGDEGRFWLWVSPRDPWTQAPTVNPLVKAPRPVSLWDDLEIGLDARRQRVKINLMEAGATGVLIGGQPRMGKSITANNILVPCMLDPSVRIWLVDGKGVDYLPLAPMAHRMVRGPEPGKVVEMLEELTGVMNTRYLALAEVGASKVARDMITPQFPLHALFIDELARYTAMANPTLRKLVGVRLRDLASIGPAAGIFLVLATQRPDTTVVDSTIRAQMRLRLALRMADWQGSNTILGDGMAKAGYDASDLLEEHQGVSLMTRSGGAVMMRAHRVEVEDLAAVAPAAMRIRRAANALPTGRPKIDHPITGAMLDAMDRAGVDRMGSAEMVEALARLSHAQWGDLNARMLAAILAPLGIYPRQLGSGRSGSNLRGYLRSEVLEMAAGNPLAVPLTTAGTTAGTPVELLTPDPLPAVE
jgi:DNA segregation ATPase FtsK/SpoIIIE, S-DNA-T family